MLRTIAILLLGLCWPTVAAAKAPVRSVETIAWAIGVDHGHIPVETRALYAAALKDAAKKYDFDPLTGVALIWHESRWRPGAVGDSGRAIGLAQIHYEGLCSSESSCEAKRQALLNPVVNIQTMGRHIDRVRQWCRDQTGRPALFARWLHAYGYNQTKDVRCNQRRTKTGWRDLPVPTELSRIIKYRKRLLKLLTQRRRASKPRSGNPPG